MGLDSIGDFFPQTICARDLAGKDVTVTIDRVTGEEFDNKPR
jgi:hypothetical protein